jgi:hypothetical protein
MTSDPNLTDHEQVGAVAEVQAGKLAFRSRTDVSFIAAVGAMVIGILLAVAAIIGAARSRR